MKSIWKKILNSTIVYLIDAVINILKIGRAKHSNQSDNNK